MPSIKYKSKDMLDVKHVPLLQDSSQERGDEKQRRSTEEEEPGDKETDGSRERKRTDKYGAAGPQLCARQGSAKTPRRRP